MIQTPYIFKCFAILLCLSTVLFFGCAEKPDSPSIPSEEVESVSSQSSIPVADGEKKTFALLRAKFPGSLLDKDFKTLRELANSALYLAYVKRTEQQAKSFKTKPFKTFNEFLDTTPPSADSLLLPLFKKHFRHRPDDQTIAHFYQIVVLFQSFEITEPTGLRVQHLEKKFDRLYTSPIFHNVIDLVRGNRKEFDAFEDAYQNLAKERSEAARKEVQERFHKYAQDDGFLWLAIEEPRTFGFILNTFADPLTTNHFLSWVNSNK